jgi:hypothetical protein
MAPSGMSFVFAVSDATTCLGRRIGHEGVCVMNQPSCGNQMRHVEPCARRESRRLTGRCKTDSDAPPENGRFLTVSREPPRLRPSRHTVTGIRSQSAILPAAGPAQERFRRPVIISEIVDAFASFPVGRDRACEMHERTITWRPSFVRKGRRSRASSAPPTVTPSFAMRPTCSQRTEIGRYETPRSSLGMGFMRNESRPRSESASGH